MSLIDDMFESLLGRVYTDGTGIPLYVFSGTSSKHIDNKPVLAINFQDLRTGKTSEFDYSGILKLKRVSGLTLVDIFRDFKND